MSLQMEYNISKDIISSMFLGILPTMNFTLKNNNYLVGIFIIKTQDKRRTCSGGCKVNVQLYKSIKKMNTNKIVLMCYTYIKL